MSADKDFSNTVADYLTFEFNMISHERGYLFQSDTKKLPMAETIPPLQNKVWKPFCIGDLFYIESGKCTQANRLKSADKGIPYVGATNRNNGVLGFVEPVEKFIQHGSCIAFIKQGEGSVGYSVYKAENFVASSSVALGYADFLNRYTGMFITTVADKVRGKYNYNYPRSEQRLRKEIIQLPVNELGEPDFEYMENYIRRIEEKILSEYQKFLQVPETFEVVPLNQKVWKAFLIEDFAEILSSQDIYEDERIAGKTPYIGASANNNGVCHFVGNENFTLEEDCISVNRNGSVGYTFYHPYAALYSNDCRKIRLREKNKFVSIFIAQQITAQREKYNYGYKMGTARLKRQKILLPVNEVGEPDFEYMEAYIKNIFAEKLQSYIDKKFADNYNQREG